MIHFKNLNKLADFLDTLPPEKFDLSSFRQDGKGLATNFKSLKDCGTIGCALGWAPFVEGLEVKKKDFDIEECDLDYRAYSQRVFNLSWHGDSRHVWDFIFSDCWTSKDMCHLENTPQATADRIRIVTSGLVRLNEKGYENK